MNLWEDEDAIDYDAYAENLEGDKELPFLADTALQVGLGMGVPAAFRALTKKSKWGVIPAAVAGALYGAGTAMYRGDDLLDVAKEGLTGAVTWPFFEVGGRFVGNLLGPGKKYLSQKGGQETAENFYGLARKKGVSAAFQDVKGLTKAQAIEDLKPILDLKLPFNKAFRERFNASTAGELLETGQEQLLKFPKGSDKRIFGENLLLSPGQHENVQVGAEDFIRGVSENPIRLKNAIAIIQNNSRRPEGMSLEEFQDVLPYFGKLGDAIKGANKNFAPEIRESVEEGFRARLKQSLLANAGFIDDIDKGLLSQLHQEVHTGGNAESIQKQLLKISKNTMIDPGVRKIAKDFMDYPAMTMKSVNEAYRKTTLQGFLDFTEKRGLALEKGAVITPEMKGKFTYVDNNPFKGNEVGEYIFGGLKNRWVDNETYRALYDIADSSRYAGKMVSKYLVRPWKVTRAVASPQPLVRNVFGNFVLNDLYGQNPLPIWRVDFYIKCAWELIDVMKHGKKNFASTYLDMAGKDVLSFKGELDTAKSMLSALEKKNSGSRAQNIADTGLEWFYGGGSKYNPGKIIKSAEIFYSFSERLAKYAKFRWNIEHGMEKMSAFEDAVKATFNYADVTPTVRMLREGPMPFATFTTKMAKRIPEAIFNHPLRVAKYMAIPWLATQAAMKNLDISDEEFEKMRANLPEYMKDGNYMLMPARDDKGRLQLLDLTWWVPGLEYASVGSTVTDPKKWISNPLWTVFRDLSTNQKGLSGAPIYNEFDTGTTKAGKFFNYIYSQLLPLPTWMPPITSALPGVSSLDDNIPLAQGGVNWKNFQNYINEKESAMTAPQVFSAGFGGKITPIDENLTALKKEKGYQRVMRDLEIQMKKELIDMPTRQDEIVQKYAYLRQQLMHKINKEQGRI